MLWDVGVSNACPLAVALVWSVSNSRANALEQMPSGSRCDKVAGVRGHRKWSNFSHISNSLFDISVLLKLLRTCFAKKILWILILTTCATNLGDVPVPLRIPSDTNSHVLHPVLCTLVMFMEKKLLKNRFSSGAMCCALCLLRVTSKCTLD